MKHKTFDCVEMKHRVQREVQKEYERRKAEFSSYAEFINKSLDESAWGKSAKSKLKRSRTGALKG